MPDWLTAKEAAAYLKISRATLYVWCSKGRLMWYSFEGERGERRFKREDLDALLEPRGPEEG